MLIEEGKIQFERALPDTEDVGPLAAKDLPDELPAVARAVDDFLDRNAFRSGEQVRVDYPGADRPLPMSRTPGAGAIAQLVKKLWVPCASSYLLNRWMRWMLRVAVPCADRAASAAWRR